MTKKDIVEIISQNTGITKKQAMDAYDIIFDSIQMSLVHKVPVTIPGFCTFKVTDRKAREGRNPFTGESLQIPAKTVVSAKIAKKFKDKIEAEN